MKRATHEESIKRIAKVRDFMDEKALDAVFYTSQENVFYLSGFTGYGDATLLITKKEQFILTDFRYNEQVIVECPDYEHVNMRSDSMPATADLMLSKGLRSVGFEDETILYTWVKSLAEEAPNIKFTGIGNFTEGLRIVKSEDELAKIEEACRISSVAFAETYEAVKPGMTEIEAAALLEYNMRKYGADGVAFTTIVASGIRGSMCHGTATEKKLEEGEAVTVDFGARYKGYDADMTRTFFIGSANSKMREIYQIVYDAQQKAIESFRVGMTGKELDAVARDYISMHGFGKYFGHGLGHGVGIMIHEDPYVNLRGETPLTEGMVFSVEPGIYVPDLGGVRIEDLACVKNGKLHIMTFFDKELKIK